MSHSKQPQGPIYDAEWVDTPESRDRSVQTSPWLLWAIIGVGVWAFTIERAYQVGWRQGLEAAPEYVQGKREFWGYIEPVEDEVCSALMTAAEDALRGTGFDHIPPARGD